jgi:hypothetical protein
MIFEALFKGFVDVFHPKMLKNLFLFSIIMVVFWILTSWFASSQIVDLLQWLSQYFTRFEKELNEATLMISENQWGLKFVAFFVLGLILSPVIWLLSTIVFSVLLVQWSVSFLKKTHYPDIPASASLIQLRLLRANLYYFVLLILFSPLFLLLYFFPPLGPLVVAAWSSFVTAKLLGQEMEIEMFGSDQKKLFSDKFTSLFFVSFFISLASHIPFVILIAPLWLALSIGHILKKAS